MAGCSPWPAATRAGAWCTTPEIWESDQWVKLTGAGRSRSRTTRATSSTRRTAASSWPASGSCRAGSTRTADGAAGRGRWISGPVAHLGRSTGTTAPPRCTSREDPGRRRRRIHRLAHARPEVVGAHRHGGDDRSQRRARRAWQSTGSDVTSRGGTSTPRSCRTARCWSPAGTSGGGFVNINPGAATKTAEVWNPTTNQWTHARRATAIDAGATTRSRCCCPTAPCCTAPAANAMVRAAGSRARRDQPRDLLAAVPVQGRAAHHHRARAGHDRLRPDVHGRHAECRRRSPTVRWIRLGSVTHAFDAASAPTR